LNEIASSLALPPKQRRASLATTYSMGLPESVIASPSLRHSESFACHSERSEESSLFAQGRLREESSFVAHYKLLAAISYFYVSAINSRLKTSPTGYRSANIAQVNV
jgi:hypothetical protein